MNQIPPLSDLEPADYKSDVTPVWCPGCGHYAVLSAITKALAELHLARENVALISGIGCSSRIPAYTSVYGFHSIHGRALPVAQGLKLARPDLTVLCAGGDGDGFSIGGNHFLHACRRNINLTYIVMDNSVYGMTKGQASPTTEADWTESKLTPEGPGVPPFQPLDIALAAGASHVVRAFSGKVQLLTKYIVEAIEHPGFSFIQVISPCVTYRPEMRALKDRVHDGFAETSNNRLEARRRLLDDDGYSLGVLFKSVEPSYTPCHRSDDGISDLERQFAL
ncbi:MAG: 2-oxoacid:ferredoxin oxidoreductase subunit beta [Rhodospirillaceae bacterium]